MPHKPGTGAIFGIVSEDGLVKESTPVYLYDMRRDVGVGEKRLLAKRFTRADGGFEFAGLDEGYTDYMLMTTDEDGVEPKNALIQDRVQPIAAHSGQAAPHEWYLRAVRDGAVAGYMNSPIHQDIGTTPTARGLFGRPRSVIEAQPSDWTPLSSPPTEYPNMSGQRPNMLGGSYTSTSRRTPSTIIGAAVEAVVDLDSVVSQSGNTFLLCVYKNHDITSWAQCTHGYPNEASNSGNISPAISYAPLAVALTPTKQLVLYVRDDTHWAIQSHRHIGWDYALTEVASFDLSAYSSTIHLVASFSSSSSVSAFVNGTLLGTVGTAHTTVPMGSHMFAVVGIAQPPPEATNNHPERSLERCERDVVTGLLVGYGRALSAQQVTQHYKALYDNDLPALVSGYAREVFVEMPHQYWRMDDLSVASGKLDFSSHVDYIDSLSGDGGVYSKLNFVGNELHITEFIASPIAGRSTIGLDAANSSYFYAQWGGTIGWPFADRGSISFWVYFDDAAPASEEQLVFLSQMTDSQEYLKIVRNTSNQLVVSLWEGGVVVSHTFTAYSPPQSSWQMVTISIDKTGDVNSVNGLIQLYVGTELTQPTLQQTILSTLDPLYTMAQVFDVTATSNHQAAVECMRYFSGSMCELALFPEALTLDRVQAHWAAKDVV